MSPLMSLDQLTASEEPTNALPTHSAVMVVDKGDI